MPLSGLDTNQISLISFWNALDNGLSDMDPQETTSAMDSHTQYSNGVDGTYTVATGESVKCRVKDDGWFIVWMDTGENYGHYIDGGQTEGSPDHTGAMNLTRKWSYETNNINPSTHTLERAINDLRTELSNSGSTNYSASDVGLYDYQNESATTITQASRVEVQQGGSNFDIDLTWETGISVYRYDVASVNRQEFATTDNSSKTYFAGNKFCDSEPSGNWTPFFAVADVLAEGWAAEGQTKQLSGVFSNTRTDNAINATALVVWE